MSLSDLPFVMGVQAPALLIVGEVARAAARNELIGDTTWTGTPKFRETSALLSS